VRELHDQGISFGSHTVTHPELTSLSNKDVEYEIRQSKKAIEDNLGKTIDTFSYPCKFPDANKAFVKDLREILQKHGYHHGVSTRIGATSKRDDRYFMKRIPINSGDDISLFKAKLEGGYNWLHKPQYLYKILKRKLQRKNA
jgi:peptidoglycan/xylan/chitin deacetylase (PgdA/CDA1 family)